MSNSRMIPKNKSATIFNRSNFNYPEKSLTVNELDIKLTEQVETDSAQNTLITTNTAALNQAITDVTTLQTTLGGL